MPRGGETWIALGLGGNLGDRHAQLRYGLWGLVQDPRIRLDQVSRPWRSAYVGPGQDQPEYLNLVCTGHTALTPHELLAVVKALEAARGRTGGHLQPRPLDIDVLLHGSTCLVAPDLVVPHPRLAERAFVLGPLAEVAPDVLLPDSGETARQAWARIQRTAAGDARPCPEPIVSSAPPDGGEEAWRAALAVHCR